MGSLRRRHRWVRRAKRLLPFAVVVSTLVVGVAVVLGATSGKERPEPYVDETELPARITAKMIADGDSIFHRTSVGARCADCHGARGKGTMAASRLSDSKWFLADGTLRTIAAVVRGGAHIPAGFGPPMPAYETMLSPSGIIAVSAYVHWLSGARTASR